LKEAVKEGLFEVVGGTWVEFDGNIPSGESMAR
jgi:alpha-mannosidase